MNALNDDLNTPKALAVLWGLVKDKKVSPADKKKTLMEFDFASFGSWNRKARKRENSG